MCLQALTLCASLNARNVIASSNLYTPQVLSSNPSLVLDLADYLMVNNKILAIAQTMPRPLQLNLDDHEWDYLPSESAVVSPDKAMRDGSSKEDVKRPSSTVEHETSPRTRLSVKPSIERSSKATMASNTRDTNLLRDRNEVISKVSLIRCEVL